MTCTTANGLGGLANRLTDAEDRERYTTILLYLQALPPEDEFRHLGELMGLLALLGQRIPDALAGALTELRQLADRAGNSYGVIDRRLATLPSEIVAGVDVAALAKGMSESFRQQLADTGLETTAQVLRHSSTEINALSNHIAATLKPASQTLMTELSKLTSASAELRSHNALLIQRERTNAWLWQAMLALVLFLAGMLCGKLLDKQQTTDALDKISQRLEQLQHPPAALPTTTSKPPKRQKGSQ